MAILSLWRAWPRARPSRQPRRIGAIAALVCLAVSVRFATGGPLKDDLDEYQVKAAFLYNFAKFVQWPSKDGPSHIVIGIVGDDPLGDVLDQIVRGKTVDGRELVVRRLRPDDDPRLCQILFVSSSEARRTPDLLMRLQASGVLTVGEAPHFLREGGVIRFYVEDSRVRFEISLQGAAHAGIRISSQLLSLASH